MAMTSCRECGKPISTTAHSCPHCGYKAEKDKIGFAKVIVGGFAAILITGVVVIMAAGPSAAPRVVTPQEEQQFKEEVGTLMFLRNNMKNPASFELASFIRTSNDTLCITYRGTNGFGAIVTQRYTVNNAVSSDGPTEWETYCAGRSGKDVSKAKYALP